MTTPQEPLTALVDRAARDHPVGTGLVHAGRTWEWSSLRDLVDRTAAHLADVGVGDGDRVALVSPLVPAVVTAMFATWRLGAVVVPLDPTWPRDRLAARLVRVDPRVVVVDVRALDAIESARPRLVGCEAVMTTDPARWSAGTARLVATAARVTGRRRRPTRDDGVLGLDEVLGMGPRMVRQAPVTGDAVAALVFDDDASDTSSGAARGPAPRTTPGEGADPIALTHTNLAAAAHQLREWVTDLREGQEVVLTTLAPWRPGGMGAGLLPAVAAGATIVLAPGATPTGVVRALEAERVTLLVAAPPTASRVAEHADLGSRDLTSLRVALAVGAWLDDEVVRRFDAATGDARLRHVHTTPAVAGAALAAPMYGTPPGTLLPVTATVAVVRRAALDARADRSWTPEDEVVDPGETGRLLVAGPQVAAGLWIGPGQVIPVAEPWLDTGELARPEVHGGVVLAGRAADVIVRPGRPPVVPSEVEDALVTDPRVRAAALVGAPRERPRHDPPGQEAPGDDPRGHDPRGHDPPDHDPPGRVPQGGPADGQAVAQSLDVELVAVVVPNGRRRPTLRRVRTHLGTLVGDHEWPDRVVIRRQLPRLPTGEVDRRVLTRLVAGARPRVPRRPGAPDRLEVGA